MKTFVATYKGKEITVKQIGAAKAIFTAAKIFGVKPTKISVRQVGGAA